MLPTSFFDKPANQLAVDLLGTTIQRRVTMPDGQQQWVSARIIETEAYFVNEKASHSSLGYTHARRAMFMPAGTVYMYYARGGDSLNFSARGDGNAVLIKSAAPLLKAEHNLSDLAAMQLLNPGSKGPRPPERLCRGQTLLCRSLDLKVPDWNARQLALDEFFIAAGQSPEQIVVTTRLGIAQSRDAHLMLRFVDESSCKLATRNPKTVRGAAAGVDYHLCSPKTAIQLSAL